MAYNFKKINNVPVVSEMKNDLNVFVEDRGKLAKIVANEMGFISTPKTASVGQTIVVKAVDENGKPIEWETKNLSSGGGGNSDILSVLITYDGADITCNKTYQEIESAIAEQKMIIVYLLESFDMPTYSPLRMEFDYNSEYLFFKKIDDYFRCYLYPGNDMDYDTGE